MSVIGRLTNDRWLSGPYGRGKSKNKNREPAKIKATTRRKIYILKQLGLVRGEFYQFRPYYDAHFIYRNNSMLFFLLANFMLNCFMHK